MDRYEATVRDLLGIAGIEVNGSQPWDPQVHNPRFYQRLLAEGGSLGLGESYMDGWWDCEQLDELISRVIGAGLEHKINPLKLIFPVIRAKLTNMQKRSRAFKIGEHHYDMGNEMYQLMLDKHMTYTCGYWKAADNLDAAQEAKLDLVCRKIGLRAGMRVLDIGCGWGSFARFAAERYAVEVVGVTVSREQIDLGRELCKGLNVDLRFQDYRSVKEPFDRVVSLGMFEHVGPKNYRTYMKVVDNCLVDDGLFLLHTIGTNNRATTTDPWSQKYIFPDGVLPTPTQVARAAENIFVIEDWHNFSIHYDATLMAWMANIDARRSELETLGYDLRFYRMWKFFLMTAAGAFRSRRSQLWQIVFSRGGLSGGYESLR